MEILDTVAIPIKGFEWNVGAIIFLMITIALALGIIVLMVWLFSEDEWELGFFAMILFLLCLIPVIGIDACGTVETGDYTYEYKVKFDDSIPMSEFLEKYEIVDHSGKIYTIKEKDNGTNS